MSDSFPSDQETAKDKIVGSWRLVSVLYEDIDTRERTPVYGAHPSGSQIATPGGRWLALMTADGRKTPETDEDRAASLRSMIAYTGRWRVEGDSVVTKVEAAWNQGWVGTEQRRKFRFEDDLLHLESPPQSHPNLLGKVVRIIVTWRREE
jgi:hypothetical protein